jgi:hypothetical protein
MSRFPIVVSKKQVRMEKEHPDDHNSFIISNGKVVVIGFATSSSAD